MRKFGKIPFGKIYFGEIHFKIAQQIMLIIKSCSLPVAPLVFKDDGKQADDHHQPP